MKLKPGQWFMYRIDEPMPDKLNVFTGCVDSPSKVTTISRFQAMAFERWHGNGPVYFSYKDGNRRWIDVRVVGDVDAWSGPEDE